ncbi:hypothetical protein [Tsukamurella sp. NPDC003166]|uniref:DUF7373 family lipoprotein n=1 Tax=Tsukamurella sp. NPDC003166 TaxID=3154444 RepID=UPI0033AD0376
MSGMRGTLIGVCTATVLAVTGCTSTVAGTAQPDPSAAVRLDTGGYPTSPRLVSSRTDRSDRRVQSSYELSAHLISPAEVDKSYDWLSSNARTPVFASITALTYQFGTAQAIALLGGGDTFVGGAISARQTDPVGRTSDTTSGMSTITLRYRTADNARKAADQLTTLARATGPDHALDGHPGAFAGPPITTVALPTVWWMPVNDYLLGVGFSASVPAGTAQQLAARWLALQVPELAKITVSASDMLGLPPDRDGIMSLTIDGTPTMPDGERPGVGYLSPRAYANSANGRWTSSMAKYERAGVDLIGAAGSVVYRTRSAADARYLLDLSNDVTAEPQAESVSAKEAPPAGVKDASCESFVTRATGEPRKAYSCSLAVGRYFITTDAASTLTQVHQQAAASHLMAKNAK